VACPTPPSGTAIFHPSEPPAERIGEDCFRERSHIPQQIEMKLPHGPQTQKKPPRSDSAETRHQPPPAAPRAVWHPYAEAVAERATCFFLTGMLPHGRPQRGSSSDGVRRGSSTWESRAARPLTSRRSTSLRRCETAFGIARTKVDAESFVSVCRWPLREMSAITRKVADGASGTYCKTVFGKDKETPAAWWMASPVFHSGTPGR